VDSPIIGDQLGPLAAFAIVADERSFTKAAVRLGVSRSAVSHSVQALEERLGLRLLARTTRTVAPTEAGERLLAELRPALFDIQAALTELGQLRAKPAGTVRLIAPPMVLATILSPKLKKFARDYPDVALDVTSEDDTRGDLVAGRFDAGIHLGEFLQRDMVAVKVTGEQRAAVVAAPSYFASHPKPKTPRELTVHRCLRYRMGAHGAVYRWEFEKRGKPVAVSVTGPLTVTDVEFMIRAALDGVGLAYTLEEYVAEDVLRGRLVRVLEDWCPPFDGYFLYYPTRRHQPPALQALVDALRIGPARL
jgi:DNA-binding transcriptional LysR family regulator